MPPQTHDAEKCTYKTKCLFSYLTIYLFEGNQNLTIKIQKILELIIVINIPGVIFGELLLGPTTTTVHA
jgi:hypothetical protein